MNKLLGFIILLVVFISCNASKNIVTALPGDIIIHSVNVIPMNEEKVIANQTVLIRNGRIKSILPFSVN
jgi:hypothetical protein